MQKFLTENGFAIENCSIIDLASNVPKTKESRKNTSSAEIIKGQFVAFDKTKYSSFVSYIKQTLERK